jgi:hypothetical protein
MKFDPETLRPDYSGEYKLKEDEEYTEEVLSYKDLNGR